MERLGWSIAEARGRSRPGGPLGSTTTTPVRTDHALPLRIERSPSELRIQTQAVIDSLAGALGVNRFSLNSKNAGTSSKLLEQKAKLLWKMRAPKAHEALQRTAWTLKDADALPPLGTSRNKAQDRRALKIDQALQILQDALSTRPKEEQGCCDSLHRALAELQAAQQSAAAPTKQDPAVVVAQGKVDLERRRVEAENKGTTLLKASKLALAQARTDNPNSAAQKGESARVSCRLVCL
jgi:hypothetical protein